MFAPRNYTVVQTGPRPHPAHVPTRQQHEQHLRMQTWELLPQSNAGLAFEADDTLQALTPSQ